MEPASLATFLLRLGCIPFPLAVVLLEALDLRSQSWLLYGLCVYSAVIISFIGGLQQAAAVLASENGGLLVGSAIGLAICAWLVLLGFTHVDGPAQACRTPSIACTSIFTQM